jgi:sulfatase modifying factor 1
MRKLVFLLLFLFLYTFAPNSLLAQDGNTPIIAVLDFGRSGISEAETRILVDYISSYIVESGKYTVIDRTQRETILEEIEFSISDCVEEACQMGKLLSANQIVVGSLGQIGERYLLNIKLIEVETGITLSTASGKFDSVEDLIDNAEGLTLRLIGEHKKHEGFGLVEAGSFWMGSNDGEADEKPVHTVTISRSFYMSQYEVTQKQWREMMGTSPSCFKGDDLPVENVRWYDAVEYCNRLSRKEGLTPCYSGSGDKIRCDFYAKGYRLPTETEWEYAARGGNMSRSHTFSGSNSAGEVGWYGDNSGGNSEPVGQKRPNELGLYDMSGNVWEWCWDWYGGYSSSFQTDPRGPSSGSFRVYRGGSWGSYVLYLRAAYRNRGIPSSGHGSIGVRPVRIAE